MTFDETLERAGAALLELLESDQPRDVCGTFWVRPSQVDAVWASRAKQGGYDKDVVRVKVKSGKEFVVWRAANNSTPGYTKYAETREELLDRVLTALGWRNT